MSLERQPALTFTRSNTRIACTCCGAPAPMTEVALDAPGSGLSLARAQLRGVHGWSFAREIGGISVSSWKPGQHVTRCPTCAHRKTPVPQN